MLRFVLLFDNAPYSSPSYFPQPTARTSEENLYGAFLAQIEPGESRGRKEIIFALEEYKKSRPFDLLKKQ